LKKVEQNTANLPGDNNNERIKDKLMLGELWIEESMPAIDNVPHRVLLYRLK
jgi:hypothetical protein